MVTESIWLPAIISAIAAVIVVWLQSRNGRSLERLRAELSQSANQRRTIFERRAEAIQDIYAKLVDAMEAWQSFLGSAIRLSTDPGPEDRHRAAVIAGEDFRQSFTRTRILLPASLAASLDGINREFVAVSNRYMGSRVSGKDEHAALLSIYQHTEGAIKTTLGDLEAAFRAALDGKE